MSKPRRRYSFSMSAFCYEQVKQHCAANNIAVAAFMEGLASKAIGFELPEKPIHQKPGPSNEPSTTPAPKKSKAKPSTLVELLDPENPDTTYVDPMLQF